MPPKVPAHALLSHLKPLPVVHICKRTYSAPTDSIPANKAKYIPTHGTYPHGFLLSSTHVGIKASNTRHPDLSLIISSKPAIGAGTFTRNVFQAAPITVCKQRLAEGKGKVRGVIINSGCANAVTGRVGIEDAWAMCGAADEAVSAFEGADGQGESEGSGGSLVMSTGVIGQRLPIQKIVGQVPTAASKLESSHEAWLGVAKAICTTDTFPKLVSREFGLPGLKGKFRMAGIAKGAGMIHPNMGTLLSVICTDAPVERKVLEPALRRAVDRTFNRISIDGDTSTNDTVLVLANGAAAGSEGQAVQRMGAEAVEAFETQLQYTCRELAQLIVRDGEGCTKFVTIRVRGASSEQSATTIAKSIACSSLVKTALYGQDANWGRILCAMGYAGLEHPGEVGAGDVVPEQTSVSFVQLEGKGDLKKGEELQLLVNGEPQNVDEEKAARMLKEEDLEILVRLRSDEQSDPTKEVEYWTCDFSHEYVTINGDYRT